ncbi:MAG: hypothetical protein QXP97_02745 [Desulfurococcus sp.]|uniref:hypothetical protein n=1 Tax=Desulfurococcus sp. TaxID=51678 RepID=UPI003165E49F
MNWRIIGLISIVALIVSIAPLASIPIIASGDQESQDSEVASDIIVGNGTMNLTVPVISVDDALNLAYMMRNITYELFMWEINHNVSVANVTLNLGDKFLDKALELKDNASRRAVVFAVVAAIHYGHAPSFANPVLARVIYSSLGENNTVTDRTVNAVITASNELKSILLNATNYAESKNFNTTLTYYWISKGDNLTSLAQQYLGEGNVTTAFRHAIAGYKAYIRAYSTLVKTVFTQYLRDLGIIRGRSFIPPGLLDKLPLELRSEIKARVENGEIKSIRDVVGEVRKEIQNRTEMWKEREYVQIANILASALVKLSKHPALTRVMMGKQLRDYCYELVKEVASRTNATGLQLLQLSLQELQNRVQGGLNIQQEFQGSVVKIRMKH